MPITWNRLREIARDLFVGDAPNPAEVVPAAKMMSQAAVVTSYGCGGESPQKDYFDPPTAKPAKPTPAQSDPTVGAESLHPDAGITPSVRQCQTFLDRLSGTGNSIPLRWKATGIGGTKEGCSKMSVTFEQMRETSDGLIEVHAVGQWASAPLGGWPDGQEFASIRQDNVPVSNWLDTESPDSPFAGLHGVALPDSAGTDGGTADQVSLHYILSGIAECTADGITTRLQIKSMVGDSSRASGLYLLALYSDTNDSCTIGFGADGGSASNESFVLVSGALGFLLDISESGRTRENKTFAFDVNDQPFYPLPAFAAATVSVELEPQTERREAPDGGQPDGGR